MQAVSELLRETWHATYDAIYGPARVAEITASWHSLEALRPRLSRPNSEFVVADDGARLGAMAFAAAGADRKVVVLHQLYVHPEHQRQGLGTELLSEIEGAFPEAERLRLEVEAANTTAVAFYRAHGFEPVGRTESCGGDTVQAIPADIYEKRLG
nr:GNAT family N-acetyltransferase [Aurantimonas sp. CSK15Z-1]